jgi:hypothetical protein
MFRSILAVISGFLSWGAICLTINQLLYVVIPDSFNKDGTTDSAELLIFLLIMSVFYSILSGFVTATIAKEKEIFHVFVQSLVNLLFGIFIQYQYWGKMPLWYHLPFLALLTPVIMLGGILGKGRKVVT